MAKLSHVLFLILLISVSSNEIIDLIRCVYQNFVPNVKLIFDLIDAIKAQDWLQVAMIGSQIYTKITGIIKTCKATKAPSFI